MSVSQIISQWQQRPFERGVTDCCAFVEYVVNTLTGESYLPHYREDFQGVIDEHGSLRDAVSHYMKAQPIPADELLPGDIALVDIMGHESIGILMETGMIAVVLEQTGLRDIRADFTDEGWSVGHWG